MIANSAPELRALAATGAEAERTLAETILDAGEAYASRWPAR